MFHTGWKACVSSKKTATGQVINDQIYNEVLRNYRVSRSHHGEHYIVCLRPCMC